MENNITVNMEIANSDNYFYDDAVQVNLEKSFHLKNKRMVDIGFFSGIYYKNTKKNIYIPFIFSNGNKSINFSIEFDTVLDNEKLEYFFISDAFKNALLNLLKNFFKYTIKNEEYRIIKKEINKI